MADISHPAPPVFVILGAAVWEGGRASNAMRRRVQGALTSAGGNSNALFLASGGVGKHPPSEARVMASLLAAAGIPGNRIILEEESTDTLSSVRNCARILRRLPAFGSVFVCSDVYHVPRTRCLFRLLGISSQAGLVPSGRSQNTLRRWVYYYLREVFALPWDVLLLGASLLTRGQPAPEA